MIEKIFLEVTTFCNAKCPFCARQDMGIDFPKSFMSLNVIERLFTDLPNLQMLDFEGNLADSPTHPKFIDILRIAIDSGCKKIHINTNGSFKDEKFWKQMAETLTVPHTVSFALDGVNQESHTRYRKNTRYEKVLKNAQAFINAGGNASWKMLPFSWNEHQENTAKELAYRMGFKEFKRNKTTRYEEPLLQEVFAEKTNQTIRQKIPMDSHLKNEMKKKIIRSTRRFKLDPLRNPHELVHDYLNSLPATCQWEQDNKVLISGNGKVYRCCHIETSSEYGNSQTRGIYQKFDESYDKNWNNINYHSILEIINHQWFQQDLPKTLANTPDNPRMFVCSKKCGIIPNFPRNAK